MTAALSLPSRAAGYAWRRTRERLLYWRGKYILQRYSRHYRRAQALYQPAGARRVRAVDAVERLGVRVLPANQPNALVGFPQGYDAIVNRVAVAASQAFEQTANCRFFPPAPDGMPARTEDYAALAERQVISIRLRNPFVLDGLHELCEPLLRSIEDAVYGSHAIVDKVYVYRNPICTLHPRTSWRWHFDNHPHEVLKLMVYLTDVSRSTAPFEYLRERDTGRCLPGSPLTPLFGESRISDLEIERRLRSGWTIERVVGPRGTVVVFDDNIVHRATLAQTAHRDVVVFQIRPAMFAAAAHIDTRWTGTFGHRDVNADPADLVQHPE